MNKSQLIKFISNIIKILDYFEIQLEHIHVYFIRQYKDISENKAYQDLQKYIKAGKINAKFVIADLSEKEDHERLPSEYGYVYANTVQSITTIAKNLCNLCKKYNIPIHRRPIPSVKAIMARIRPIYLPIPTMETVTPNCTIIVTTPDGKTITPLAIGYFILVARFITRNADHKDLIPHFGMHVSAKLYEQAQLMPEQKKPKTLTRMYTQALIRDYHNGVTILSNEISLEIDIEREQYLNMKSRILYRTRA